jgi:sirohydrochlorin ferrochelatase
LASFRFFHSMTTGIIVFAHGSRIEPANQAVRSVAADLARAGNFAHVEAAFLELGQPALQGAVTTLLSNGVTRILVIPYFLTLGMHLERDLPRLIDAIAQAHPGIEISVTKPLDGHPALVQALLDRANSLSQKHSTNT